MTGTATNTQENKPHNTQSAEVFEQITPVLLAGGSGKRLWPLSTKKTPKPFIRTLGQSSLFEKTLVRLSGVQSVVVCGHMDHASHFKEQIPAPLMSQSHIILEHKTLGTAAPVAMAAHYIHHKNPETILCVMPTDHYIKNNAALFTALRQSASLVNDTNFVSLGIRAPHYKARYGYMMFDAANQNAEILRANSFNVSAFKEKPHKDLVAQSLLAKRAFWNTGIVLFKPAALINYLKASYPEFQTVSEKSVQYASRQNSFIIPDPQSFDLLEEGSFDKMVLEKTSDHMLTALKTRWEDCGTFGSFVRYHIMG